MNYKGQAVELSQEKSIKHPSGNVEKAVGHMQLELGEVYVRSINLRVQS